MKILFVHKDINISTPAGGINAVYLEHIKELSIIPGIEIAIITGREGEWNLQAKRFITKEIDMFQRQKEITEIINQYDPDIVDCFNWHAEILDYVSKPHRAKTVMRADIPMHYYKTTPFLDEELAHKVDAIVAISRWCMGEWAPLTSKKLILIPHAGTDKVDTHINKIPNSVLWVGKATEMKGFNKLFSFDDLFYEEYQLICVIAKTRFTDEKQLNKLKNKRVIVYENLSRQKYDFISHTSQFILSTARKEGFCIAILEAMQTGAVPIVPFYIGGPLDFVNHKNGIIYNHESEIYNMIKNTKNMEQKSKLSKKKAKTYKWDAIVKRSLVLYKEMLK
jgi:glycosyltransferase involved in cell wall biosynthesis